MEAFSRKTQQIKGILRKNCSRELKGHATNLTFRMLQQLTKVIIMFFYW